MSEIHNIEFVLAAYGITFGVIALYVAWIWSRTAKIKRQQAELQQDR